MKKLTDFRNDIKGTFFEELLETPITLINLPVLSGDLKIGDATPLELKCMHFFLRHYYPEKFQDIVIEETSKLTSDLRAHTVLGVMRSLISDRLKLDSNIINRLWIRDNGIIVVEKKFTEHGLI